MAMFQFGRRIIEPNVRPWGKASVAGIPLSPYALSFDGSGNYVDCTNNVWVNHTKQTAELIFKRRSDQGSSTNHSVHNVLLAKASGDDNDNFELGTNGSDIEMYFDCSDGGENNTKAFSAGIQNDTWYHLAVTFNNGQVYIYLGGAQVGSYDWGGAMASDADPSVFAIGESQHEGAPFDGLMLDVRIWDIVLTQQEIQNRRSTGLAGNETGLAAYYPCTEGSGTTLTDATGNGNDGTINGATWVERAA